MWNFLRPDSKFMFYANKASDLMGLNLLMLLFCLPVFTLGPSVTAMHYVLLKILRDELEEGVIRTFWKAFRSNFKQATLLWLIYLPIGLLLGLDLLLFHKGLFSLPQILKYFLIALLVVWLLNLNWALILQSRYYNPVKITLRNALLFCLFHPIDTLLISAVLCVPFALIIFMPEMTPVVLLCGFGLSGILAAALYNRIFIHHEKETAQEEN